jgi:hypothetical protein
MSTIRLGLAAAAALGLALAATAAPLPGPQSQGPISDYLRLRGKLPATAPPHVMHVEDGDGILVVERFTVSYVQEVRKEIVEQDGVKKEVVVTVTRAVPVATKATATAKDCKFFQVGKDGKLEAIDYKKAAPLLKKSTAVLTGDSEEVDPRHLEVVKPGTLYLVLPPVPTEVIPPPGAPLDKLPDKTRD